MLYLHLGLNTLKGGDNLSMLQATLPNIYGRFIPGAPGRFLSCNNFSGAFTGLQSEWNQGAAEQGNTGDNAGVTFNAHLSNPIYSEDCTTVQPPALQIIPQIKF